MSETLEQSFRRFRRTGSPASLATVYDGCAAELLRVAIHLAPDAASAEDLVQATFLTAIEKAATFEDGRPVVPWLVGILTNHARALRRRRRPLSASEVGTVPDRADAAPTPEVHAQTEEFSQAVDDAITRLPESYQPVLVLRLRHGFEPAEIAHTLRRPPATVRTQLVRGLEQLRALLPASIAGSLALLLTPTRGLAAIREVVLTHAAQAAGLGITASLIGGILLMKKTLTVALVAVLAIFGYLIWPSQPVAPDAGEATRTTDARVTAPPEAATRVVEDTAIPTRSPVTAPPQPARRTWVLHGRIEPVASVPLTAAVVRAHPGRSTDRTVSFSRLMEISAHQGEGYVNDTAIALRIEGDAVAEAPILPDGSFVLGGLHEPHLRLVLDHPFYAFTQVVPAHTEPEDTVVDLGLVDSYCGGQVVGRVLADRPLDDARVLLTSDPDPMQVLREPEAFLATTLRAGGSEQTPDGDGRFVFRAVGSSPAIRVTLQHDEIVASAPPMSIGPGETREVLLRSRPAGRLSVTVHDADGTPVDRARVRVSPGDVSGQLSRTRLAHYQRTDPDGRAAFTGLRSGTFKVFAEREGLLHARCEVAVVQGGDAHADLELARGSVIRGRVIDSEGAPVVDAGVAFVPDFEVPMLGRVSDFTGTETWGRLASRSRIRTDDDGHFELGGAGTEGALAIAAHREDFVGGLESGIAPNSEDVTIVLQHPVRVVGRVVEADGHTPVRAFEIRTVAGMALFMSRPTAVAVVTDSTDGRFEMSFVPPGRVDLRIDVPGRGRTQRKIEVVSPGLLDVGDIVIQPTGAIEGHVVDTAGTPIADAVVREARRGLANNPLMSMFLDTPEVRTAIDGSFRFDQIAAGHIALQATVNGHASARTRPIEVAPGECVTGVELRLGHGGSLEGLLLLGPGQDIRDWDVIVTREPQASTQIVHPNPDGSFHVDHLDPGRYQIQAMDMAAMTRVQSRTLGDLAPGSVPDIGALMRSVQDFTVMARARVEEGEVAMVELDATDFEATGTDLELEILIGDRPMPQAIVEAVSLHGDRPEGLRMGFADDGVVRFDGLRPGLVRLQVRSGMTMSPVGDPLTLEIPERGGLVRHTWRLPGGAIEGTVVDDETGTELAGAIVRLVTARFGEDGRDRDAGFALTDQEGKFAFRGLADGTYSVLADDLLAAGGRPPTIGRVDGLRVTAGATAEATLRAHRGAGLRIIVTDSSGRPLVGARLLAADADGVPLGLLPIARTDADGEAFFSGLPGGETRVVAWSGSLAPAVSAVTRLEPETRATVRVVLERGTEVSLRLVDADGEALGSATVAVRWAGGPWMPTALFDRQVREDGTIDLGPLPPGPVDISVVHPRARFEARRTVPSGARASFVLQR